MPEVFFQCPKCKKATDSTEWNFQFRSQSNSMGNYLRVVCPTCGYMAKARVELFTYTLSPIGYAKEDF